ncbi:MAG: response regulator transcription factor [Bacteroidota bacterium]
MTHILIVDDHAVFAESLAHRLNNEVDFTVLATPKNAQEAREILENPSNNIDVALVDIRIDNNETEGLELAIHIKNFYKKIKVIMLSMHDEGSYGKRMLDAGIPGYILKSSHIEEVIKAIRFVKEGRRYYGREIESAIARYNQQAEKINSSKIVLTPTEKKILNHIAEGKSSKDISEIMGNKESTVEVHRRNIFAKFNVNKVALLITEGIRLGFIKVK